MGLFCGVLWVCFMVAVGLLVVAVLCWHWIVFFFFGSATGVYGCDWWADGGGSGSSCGWWADGGGGGNSCGWWANGGVGVCGSVGVGFGSVGGGVGFFFFFFFLGVDGRLWVASGGGGGGVRCV